MIQRTYLIYGFILLSLLALLAAANFYYIIPAFMSSQPAQAPQPEVVAAPAAVPSPPEKIKVTDNLEAIRNLPRVPEPPEGEFLDMLVRNPFLWPEEMLKVLQEEYRRALAGDEAESAREMAAPVAEAAVDKRQYLPKLSMIIKGENKSMALMDDMFVHEGDSINDSIVREIKKDAVILAGDAGEYTVTFETGGQTLIIPALQAPPDKMPAEIGPPKAGSIEVKGPQDQKSIQMQMEMIKILFEQLKPHLQEGSK